MGIEHGSLFPTTIQEFQDVSWDSDGYYFTNEEGFKDLIPELSKSREPNPGGLGLVIGSGAIYSLLPELNLDTLLVVDSNGLVLDYTKMVGAAIESSYTPKEVENKIFGYDENFQPEIIKEIKESDYITNLNVIEHTLFSEELFNLDIYHWTNEDRFSLTKKALETTKIYFLHANIQDPILIKLLNNYLNVKSLAYINLSNVHGYLDNIDFISDFPINHQTTIQYSDHKDVEYGSYPKTKLANNIEDYINLIYQNMELLSVVFESN